MAALPGPRTYREAPPPREDERVDLEAVDERTIADEPLPLDEEPPVDEPTAEEPVRLEEVEYEEPVEYELDAGVTPSADWELDEDPASYSAPI